MSQMGKHKREKGNDWFLQIQSFQMLYYYKVPWKKVNKGVRNIKFRGLRSHTFNDMVEQTLKY